MYRLILILWIALVLAYGLAKAQAPTLVDDHVTDSPQRIDAMRLALGNITYFDGKRIEMVLIAQSGSEHWTFEADENSKLDITKDFKPDDHKKDLWWVVFCSKNHSHTPDEKIYYPYLLTRATPTVVKK